MSMKVLHARICALLSIVLLALVNACTMLPEYDVNINEIDTEVSVFEDGLTLPLGSTNKVVLSSLLNSAGESIDEFLKTDPATGALVLSYEGSASLGEQLQQLDLSSISNVDGISISKDFNYHLGDLNVENFSVPAQNYDVSVAFTGVESVDLSIPAIDANLDALNFKAGMDKYKNVVNGNADLRIGDKLGNVGYDKTISRSETLNQWAALALALVDPTDDTPYPVPAGYIDESVNVPSTSIPVKVDGFALHEEITAIRNIQIDPNAKMVIGLKVTTPYINGGTVVPDLNLDLSGLLNISGGSPINLSGLALSAANNWTSSKTYDVTGLATTDYEGTIAIDENITVEGTVYINDPTVSAKSLNNSSMKLEVSIQFTDLTIISAEVDIKSIEFTHSDVVTVGSATPFDVPDAITDIKEVKMDETKPINLKITPSNLNCIKQKNLPYKIELQFPETVEVEDAVNGKLTFEGDMATEGALNKNIVIKAFHPVVAGGKVDVNADIEINAEFKAQNLVVSTDDIPSTPEGDLSFAVTLDGNPAISDITVTIAPIEKETEIADTIEFEVNGLDSFGSFVITPEGAPALTITCNIPDLPNLEILPGAEGILMTMPDIFEFETSNLNPSVVFTAETNTLFIKDAIPTTIELPIKCLKVHPVVVNDVAKVVTNYAVTGSIVIPAADISHSDIQSVSGSEFGIQVSIPELKVKTLDLDDEISFDIDNTYDFGFDLDTGGIVKQIAEVSLDNVFFNLEATFEGLPDMGDEPFAVDLTLTLPDFIVPNVIPVQGTVKNNKIAIDPVQIVKLADIQIGSNNRVEGSLKVEGTVSASGKNIDLSTLQSDINVNFNASIGDGQGKIAIGKVSGAFSYQVNQDASVKLDMPEMLKDDSVCLDLADPQIALTITTNLGVRMAGNITIIPIENGEDLTDEKIELAVTLPYSETAAETVTKSYVICNSALTAPEGFEPIEANVSHLLAMLPEELRVEIRAGIVETALSVVETNAEYTLDVTYGVSAPVAFGKDFHFTTNTEFDMGQVSQFTSYGEFGVRGKAVNDSPVNLNVKMVLLDAQGAEIPQSKPSTIVVAGASTSDIEFFLSPTDKSRAISKARLDIEVTAVPGMPLMETSSLQLTDMVAVLPEGLTVDPKDLMN